jgi:hypothetical protein
MKETQICANSGSSISRRQFLSGCAACAACFAGVPALGTQPVAPIHIPVPTEKAKVRLVFTHRSPDLATWPHIGYDYDARAKELTAKLRASCQGIDFFPVTAQTGADAQKILEADADVDGYMVYMTGLWTNAPQTIAASGRPTIFVDDNYSGSGEFLQAHAEARRKSFKVAGVSSSRFEDVVNAAKCFECMARLRSSTILQVGTGFGSMDKGIFEAFGTKVRPLVHQQLDDAYKKADRAQAAKWADKWMRGAKKIVEPSREEIRKSGAMYLAMCKLMQDRNAQAITIDCLGGFYGGKITAYPCLGFFQLNNDGYVGACEADLKSTITMLVMTYLVGRPGYISDPVIDTSKNRIIYAHCVAPNKVFGPDGPTNPYHIRSHSEDRKGAAIRSLMPLGEMTTTVEFDTDNRRVLIHQAKTVENVDEDRACRTKLAAEVRGDIYKLMGNWQGGWHRVTFYGDHKQQVRNLAALIGFEVVEEA